MGYKKLDNNGEFFKFTEEGQELEGKWLGSAPGKYGVNGAIRDANDKKIIFGLSAGLRDLDHVAPGTQIKIVFTGYAQVKNRPQPMKTFDLFIDESVDVYAIQAKAMAAKGKKPSGSFQATDEDVPF